MYADAQRARVFGSQAGGWLPQVRNSKTDLTVSFQAGRKRELRAGISRLGPTKRSQTLAVQQKLRPVWSGKAAGGAYDQGCFPWIYNYGHVSLPRSRPAVSLLAGVPFRGKYRDAGVPDMVNVARRQRIVPVTKMLRCKRLQSSDRTWIRMDRQNRQNHSDAGQNVIGRMMPLGGKTPQYSGALVANGAWAYLREAQEDAIVTASDPSGKRAGAKHPSRGGDQQALR